jgi:hypothetical protein
MRVALEQANVSLGLHAQQQQQQQQQQAASAPPLLSALHPNRQLLVLARGPVLSFLPVQSEDGSNAAASAAAQTSSPRAPKAAPSAASAGPRRTSSRARGASAAPGPGPPGSPGGAGATATGGPFYTLRSSQDITALAWLCVLAGGSRQLGAASLTVRPPDLADLLECECLLVGTKDGALQLHDGSGCMLFRQRVHTGPVEHISIRPCATGARG